MARELVYFISYENGPVKIGKARNVKMRLREIQTGNAYKLEILGVLIGAPGLERRLHDQFHDLRMSGEWFKRDQKLIDFICEYSLPGNCEYTNPKIFDLSDKINDLEKDLTSKLQSLKSQFAAELCLKTAEEMTETVAETMYRWLVACERLQNSITAIEERYKVHFTQQMGLEIRRVIDSALDTNWRESLHAMSLQESKIDQTLKRIAHRYVLNRFQKFLPERINRKIDNEIRNRTLEAADEKTTA